MTSKPQLQAGANYVLVYRDIPTLKATKPDRTPKYSAVNWEVLGALVGIVAWLGFLAYLAYLALRHWH